CAVVRERRGGVDRLSRDGMGERETRRMQELALEPEISCDPVDPVARNGEVDRGEVDADLVRSAGLEPDAEERMAGQELLELEVRHGRARRGGVQGVAKPVVPVASDRRVDRAAP